MNEIPTNNPEFFPDGLMESVVTEATTSIECVNNNKRNGKINWKITSDVMSKRAEERALEEYGPQNDALFPGDGNDNKARRIGFIQGYKQAEKDLLEVSDMKSPFTGGKVLRGMEKKTITFRGEEYIVPQRFFKCQDSGIEFTNAAIDDDNIWEVIKAYFNRKEISPFDLIALTWEDIDKIIQFWMAVLDEMDGTKQELYTKIAELFNESRK